MNHASTRTDVPAPAAVTGSSGSPGPAGSGVQMRSALRGQDFSQQEGALAPVQRKAEPGAAATATSTDAPIQMHASRSTRGVHPVQMHAADPIQMHATQPVQMHAADLVQMHSDPVQMRGGKAEEYYGGYTMAGTGVTDKHMFQGEGGDVPKGLHSYAGGMAGITVLATIGNTNGVHVIVWTWTANTGKPSPKCKWSSMFPQNMSKGMVCWYVKRFSEGKSTDGQPNDVEQRPGTGYSGITLAGAGDTIYPLCGTQYASAAEYVAAGPGGQGEGVTFAGKFYKIANPGR